MKNYVWVCGVILLVQVLWSCGTGYKVYGVREYSDYDTIRSVFVRKDKKDENIRLIVSPEEYLLYSPERKILLRRISPSTEYADAYYSYVLYKGVRCRLVEYNDDGYYGEGKKTYLLYDMKQRHPIMGFSVEGKDDYTIARATELESVLKDPDVINLHKIKAEKKEDNHPERMYLLRKGYD